MREKISGKVYIVCLRKMKTGKKQTERMEIDESI